MFDQLQPVGEAFRSLPLVHRLNMKTTVLLQRNLQSVRTQIEQTLHTVPWADAKMAELRLRIEEAIEVSYEVEMARAPVPEWRCQRPCSAMPDDDNAARSSHASLRDRIVPRRVVSLTRGA